MKFIFCFKFCAINTINIFVCKHLENIVNFQIYLLHPTFRPSLPSYFCQSSSSIALFFIVFIISSMQVVVGFTLLFCGAYCKALSHLSSSILFTCLYHNNCLFSILSTFVYISRSWFYFFIWDMFVL